MQNHAGDRLVRQIEAYNDNEVNVALLLEDSQAREFYQQECEQRESEIFSLQTQLGSSKAEHEAQTAELRNALQELQKRCTELEVSKHCCMPGHFIPIFSILVLKSLSYVFTFLRQIVRMTDYSGLSGLKTRTQQEFLPDLNSEVI